jgi:hypothetical protein
MKGQPDPSDMLEELADKAITHIGRLAVTSFESALSEMVDFHRFLIDAYATRDENGKPVSFAQIGDWESLHKEWIRQYRRLFERAVENIGREKDFVEILVHLPMQLLPRDARNAAPEVVAGLLDLPSIFVHRLEGWLSQRRSYDTAEEGRPSRAHLAGSDKRAYEDIIISFVGAWENLLQTVSAVYEWRQREVESEEQWLRYVASWTFLQQHLRNSAYLLAVAVWNEDEIGAKYYRESLLRWLDGLQHEFDVYDHQARRFLTADLLQSDWGTARTLLARSVEFPEWDQPTPTFVFVEILQNQLSDVVTVASGVMLAWFIEGKQMTDIAPLTVSHLLKDIVAEDGGYRVGRETGFRPLMLGISRIWVCAERFERKGHGHWLDRLVSLLDSMSERRIVPGRVYSPSTRNERDDLRLPWLVCLIASLPPEGDDGAVESIGKLTEREEAFSHGDQTLRGLLYEYRQTVGALAPQNWGYLKRGVAALDKDLNFEERVKRLTSILEEAILAIENRRLQRLRERPISQDKLSELRERVEAMLLSGNGGIEVFRDFSIERDGAGVDERILRVSQVEKGYLTEPAMAQEPVNLWDAVLRFVRSSAAGFVWRDFVQRPRRVIDIQDEAAYRAVLFAEAKGMVDAGQQPVLLVHRGHEPPWIKKWFGWGEKPPEGINVVRKKGMGTNLYAGTVNNIDVYRMELVADRSLLFRADLLRKVKYRSDNEGHVAGIAFDEKAEKGLVLRFFQGTEWREDEALELVCPVPSLET